MSVCVCLGLLDPPWVRFADLIGNNVLMFLAKLNKTRLNFHWSRLDRTGVVIPSLWMKMGGWDGREGAPGSIRASHWIAEIWMRMDSFFPSC